MRLCFLFVAIGGLWLGGCSGGSQPGAGRGEPERRFESSSAAGVAEEESSSAVADAEPSAPPAGDNAPPQAGDSDRVVELDALKLTAPEGWTRKPARTAFVEAEFALPKAEGDEADGRLTVSLAGGSVQANIERWKGQFTDLKDMDEEKLRANSLEVTLVDLAGEFNDQRGPFAPATKHADYRMIAAIIPVGEQLHFVKATGPQKTMESHAAAIKAFVLSAQRK